MPGVRAKVRVTDKDHGYKAYLERLKKLHGRSYVKIGILGASALSPAKVRTPDGIVDSKVSLVDVATFHEFGAGNNPQRSFIRSTMDAHKDYFRKLLVDQLFYVLAGKRPAKNALAILGEAIQAKMQGVFTDNDWAPLSAATIKHRANRTPSRKKAANETFAGTVRPLLDTGQLRRSIRYQVVMADGETAEGGEKEGAGE